MKPVDRATLQAALGSALARTLPESLYLQLDAATVEEALTVAAQERAAQMGEADLIRLSKALIMRDVDVDEDPVAAAIAAIDRYEATVAAFEEREDARPTTATLRLRPGRRAHRTLYQVTGDNPDRDRLIGVVDTAELATAICAAVNQAASEARGSAEERSDDTKSNQDRGEE